MNTHATQSTSEAMEVLNEYRGFLVKRGRWEAVRIARAMGSVHGRQVRDALEEQGLLNNPNLADVWLGACFNSKAFEWTGEWYTYSDPSRNIHERTIKIWKLSESYAGAAIKPEWMGARVGKRVIPPKKSKPADVKTKRKPLSMI